MKKLIYILLGVLAFSSCKKDNSKIAPTLSFTINARALGDADYTLRAPKSNSSGSFSYTSSNAAVATITNGTVSIKGVGTTTITAVQAASDDYTEGTISQTLTVVPAGTYVIGQAITGGIVFAVAGTGNHGYMISDVDVATAAPWSTGSLASATATTSSIGGGAVNTTNIITLMGDGYYAAKLCRDYRAGNYTDWYLPSQAELVVIRQRADQIGGITETSYWSSTEVSATLTNANYIYFGPGTLTGTSVTVNNYLKTSNYSVRAIRYF